MAGGKGGSNISLPHASDLGNLYAASQFQQQAQRNPGAAQMFAAGTPLGDSYKSVFGTNQLPAAQPWHLADTGNIAGNAAARMSGVSQGFNPIKPPAQGMMKGAGALSPVPTGQPAAAPMASPQMGPGTQAKALSFVPGPMQSGASGGSQPSMGSPSSANKGGAQTKTFGPPSFGSSGAPGSLPTGSQAFQYVAPNQLQVPQQQYDIQRQLGSEQINRANQAGQQDLMRQFAARGLGRSGLELGAAAGFYNRGAGQQTADLNRGITESQLGQQFEANKLMDQLNLATQQAQAGENLSRSQLGSQNALGLGQLGLGERQQGLAETQARTAYENPSTGLGGLAQSLLSGQASTGKGK